MGVATVWLFCAAVCVCLDGPKESYSIDIAWVGGDECEAVRRGWLVAARPDQPTTDQTRTWESSVAQASSAAVRGEAVGGGGETERKDVAEGQGAAQPRPPRVGWLAGHRAQMQASTQAQAQAHHSPLTHFFLSSSLLPIAYTHPRHHIHTTLTARQPAMSADTATATTTPAANGNGTHAKDASDKKYNVDIAKMPGAHGKPDKAHHDAEMDRLKKEIDKVQVEVVSTQA